MCQTLRAGEAVDLLSRRSFAAARARVHHLLRGALAHALGVAVAPDIGRAGCPCAARQWGRTPPARRGDC